ncbi:hypothetical protein B0H10DRAFT_2061414 [Mycena sp. CBHHK59/15]|nr:hypothetical protein B0H10DRAFT_2061414 [Mycena sp. CBHHK59/15]
MFVEDSARWPVTPSSSPPSSPNPYNDSSPPSSPGLGTDSVEFADSRYLGSSPPTHPFAATAKGSWIPPDYEKGLKKNTRASSSPSEVRPKKARLIGPEDCVPLEPISLPPRQSVVPTKEEQEACIWDDAISKMVDNGNGTIQLSNLNLSSIPEKFVEDLNNFYVPEANTELENTRHMPPPSLPPPPEHRQFSRAITAPAVLGSTNSFPRTVGFAREKIQLFLAGNQISSLPSRLLCLDKLTTLSLRNNNLEFIPPEIKNLRNLQNLNISGNHLRFLPAEICQLTLEEIFIFPNAFEDLGEPKLTKRQLHRVRSTPGPVAVSPTRHILPQVSPLVELMLRSLFSKESGPSSLENHAGRRIEEYYELPLCEDGEFDFGSRSSKREFRRVVPPHLRRILEAIHPGSVYVDGSSKLPDDHATLGVCPSPCHVHRESRNIAGRDVGCAVPLKWRGCMWGCLDFLGEGIEMEEPVLDGETMEVDEGEVVTVVQLPALPTDDFEEDG